MAVSRPRCAITPQPEDLRHDRRHHSLAAPRSVHRDWTPSDRDRLVFQWVKFEGHTQGWVAEQLEINQSTVSRIVERYERWIAHGGPARQGGLSHDERLRAQLWLTYER